MDTAAERDHLGDQSELLHCPALVGVACGDQMAAPALMTSRTPRNVNEAEVRKTAAGQTPNVSYWTSPTRDNALSSVVFSSFILSLHA